MRVLEGTALWYQEPYLRTSGREQVPGPYTKVLFVLSTSHLVLAGSTTRLQNGYFDGVIG